MSDLIHKHLKRLKNKNVIVHVINGVYVDGILSEVFHLYVDENQPLMFRVVGDGDTVALCQVNMIRLISDNEIVLKRAEAVTE